ncbi:MAG: hypothetical protein A2Z42_04535 [Candidatus Woykebacteria bacterium RBG_19FT_COMBO_43_10]|uniref:Uncharacterized protein n=1 Tax=Candidatus Woykebacteria bacterium RBG_19FT_COMBO_43_10 TaxID=1802598 RepID=A0A1G1WFB9_9BACT|nr:MAG: hypothetical protein A2Z42_04535 [Candidatus Woykebacteria bacterium RBG_19FT_COMBO_43_10]
MFRGIVIALVIGLLMAFLAILPTEKTYAVNCPLPGDILVGSVISPNGNTTIVCKDTGGGHSWYIYNTSAQQIGSGGCSCYVALLGLMTVNDSKVIIVLRADDGGIGWHIHGANGAQLNSSGGSVYTVLLALIGTNDSKIAIVLGTADNALGWYIYGPNGQQLNSSGWSNSTLISASATADNKIIIVICHTNTNERRTYIYRADGSLESNNITGTCSVVGVGGIAEFPEIAGPQVATSETSPTDYALWAGIAAGATTGLIVIGTSLWYTRRRRLS